jgi:hypothetical protein
VSGEYGTLSGININILNYNKFFDFIQTNDILITGRKVRVFVVLDNVFYQIWNGIVQNLPYDETSYTIECKDDYKQIHKVMPPNVISVSEFPESEEQGEAIPIVIGDVSYSKLVDAGDKPIYIDLCSTDYFFKSDFIVQGKNLLTDLIDSSESFNYKLAALALFDGAYGSPYVYISIWTKGITFNSNTLTGYYIIGKSGTGLDSDYASLILGNDQSVYNISKERYKTRIKVSGDLSGFNPADISNHYYFDAANYDDVWWFSICKLDSYYIASYNNINRFITDKYGNYLLYTFDKEKNEFKNVSSIINSVNTVNTLSEYPGLNIVTKKRTLDGEIDYLYGITPHQFIITGGYDSLIEKSVSRFAIGATDGWTIVASHGWTLDLQKYISGNLDLYFSDDGITEDGPHGSIASDVTLAVINKNVNSYVRCEGYGSLSLSVDILLPISSLNDNFSDLYIAVDYKITNENNLKYSTYSSTTFYDVYDAPIETNFSTTNKNNSFNYPADASYISTPIDIHQLPKVYYNGGVPWSDSDYESNKSFWGRTDEYFKDSVLEYQVYNDLIKVDSGMISNIKDGLLSNRIKVEINCLKEVKDGDSNKTNIYVYDIGFVAKKSLDIVSDDLYVRINGNTSGITGMKDSVYTAYKTILEQYDTYGYTGGYTGMSLGYTGANFIDYGNLPEVRDDWYVGRQITERKNSYEYLNELCKHSFVGMFPTRTGNRKLVAWRDLTNYTATIGETGIVRDSIQNFNRTEISQIYNDFKCEYSYNQATKKFDRCLIVTHSDSESFPSSYDPAWKKYVQGLNTNSYADAKDTWDIAHNAYDVTRTIQQNHSDTQKLYWYYDKSIFDNIEFVGASVDDAAYKFLQNLVVWTGLQKESCRFSVPMSAANLQLELCDMVLFEDGFFTDSVQRKGWITYVEVDTKKDQIRLEVTLEPIELVDYNLIIERGIPLNVDEISESGSNTTDIEES